MSNQNRFLSNLSSDIDAKDSVVPLTASRSVECVRRQAEGIDTALSVHRVTSFKSAPATESVLCFPYGLDVVLNCCTKNISDMSVQ